MKELMIHVERIVRPIHGGNKLRMRRELLAHLQAAIQEERDRGLDEPAAMTQAKLRLGDSAELRRQLQASVPFWDRMGETPFPGSIRWMVIVLAVLIPAIVALTPIPAGLTSPHPRSFASVAETAPPHARAILVTGIVALELSAFLWFTSIIEVFRPRTRWGRALLAGLAAVLVDIAWKCTIAFALTGRAVPNHVADVAFEQLLIPGFFIFGGIAVILSRRPAREWLDLEIA